MAKSTKCPNCGQSHVLVNKKGWLKTRYECANPLCTTQGQVFSKKTWLGAGVKVASVGLAIVSLLSGGGS